MTGRQAEIAGAAKGPGAARPTPTPSGVLTALKQAPLGIAIFDREMRYLAASSQFLTDQGLPGDTPLVGRLHYDVFPDLPQRWRETHVLALREGVELSHEADPYPRSDGRLDFIRWSLKPWRAEDGEIGGLVLYTEFVTSSVESRLRLEAAEARYRAVFDQAAVGVARVSPDGVFLEVNDKFCAISRYSREEVLGRPLQAITHPDDIEPEGVQLRALLAGEIDTFTMEKRYLTKTRDVVWIQLTASMVRTLEGEPDHLLGIVEDIAERKKVEAQHLRYQSQLRLMINELNHRVKNTLATVQSIAAQTMRGDEAAFEKFEARLLGLSEVHDVLTREHWHGAALKEVAERALHPFTSETTGQASVVGPDVWLQPGAALTMALVFHELATNAVKYGALSVKGGRVDLTWTLDPANERLKLTWAESGGPPVTPPAQTGFGTRLIERGLRGDLQGSAETRYDPGGLVCAMEAHAPQRKDAPNFAP